MEKILLLDLTLGVSIIIREWSDVWFVTWGFGLGSWRMLMSEEKKKKTRSVVLDRPSPYHVAAS